MERRYTIADILPPALTERDRGKIMKAAGEDVVAQIQQWYASRGEAYFDGPRHPKSKRRSFMRAIHDHWFSSVTGTGFDVYFSNPREGGGNFGLLVHEYGATIRPKTSKYIAVPIHEDAFGVRPREYGGAHGKLIFEPRKKGKGRNAQHLAGVMRWKDDHGELVTAYALYRQVTIPSLQERRGHPAIPPEADVRAMATRSLKAMIAANYRPH